MELKQIKELMMSMSRAGTKRLKIVKDGFELELEQQDRNAPHSIYPETTEELSLKGEETLRRHRAVELPSSQPLTQKAESIVDSSSLFITSPMVGTFYVTPSPEDPPFIKVGDTVDKNTLVCIIEAMKVMNEIKSGVSGTVIEVLIQNGHPVEFGTRLFRIQPS